MSGIDLMEIDLDVVESRPRLDSSKQRSKALAVKREVTMRRLPTKVATKMGTMYPLYRKDLMKLTEDHHGYTTQKSAPTGHSQKEREKDIRTRLGIGRGSPLAGLASVMEGGLSKISPRSSPTSAHKEQVTPPTVAPKPNKKTIKASPVQSMIVDSQLTSQRNEEVKTSTQNHNMEEPPEPKTPSESQTPRKKMEPEPVPEKKQDTFKEVEPAGIEKNNKGDENIPEWKKRLEERRAACIKEQENIQSSTEIRTWFDISRGNSSAGQASVMKGELSEERKTIELVPPIVLLNKEPQVPSEEKESKLVLEKGSELDLEKKSEPKPVPEKKLKLVPEKKMEPEPVPEKKLGSVPDLEKKMNPEPVSEKKLEPVPEKKMDPKPVPEKKPETLPEKKMEPEPVPEKKQDTSTVVEPAGIEKTKKGDENIPEWKRRLEVRRAARLKEQENIQSSTEAPVCANIQAIQQREEILGGSRRDGSYNSRLNRRTELYLKQNDHLRNLVQRVNLRKQRSALIIGGVIAICLIILLIFVFH